MCDLKQTVLGSHVWSRTNSLRVTCVIQNKQF